LNSLWKETETVLVSYPHLCKNKPTYWLINFLDRLALSWTMNLDVTSFEYISSNKIYNTSVLLPMNVVISQLCLDAKESSINQSKPNYS